MPTSLKYLQRTLGPLGFAGCGLYGAIAFLGFAFGSRSVLIFLLCTISLTLAYGLLRDRTAPDVEAA